MLKLNETPSRILRRINEEDKEELVSLPSIDDQEYSGLTETESDHTTTQIKENEKPQNLAASFLNPVQAQTPDRFNMVNKTPKDASKRSVTQPNVLMSAMKDKAKPSVNTTPFPKTVSFSRKPQETNNDSLEPSFASSNNDLITPRQPAANANESGNTGNRFDGTKLNSYLNSLNEHLATENHQLATALENAKEDALDAQEQLRLAGDEHYAENQQLRDEINRLKSSQTHTSSEEVQKLSYTVDKLQEEVLHYKSRSKQLEEEVTNLDNDKYQLSKEMNDARKFNKTFDVEKDKYERTIARLEADLHDFDIELDRRQTMFNSRIDEYKKVNEDMDNHLRANQIEIEQLRGDNSRLSGEIQLLKIRSPPQTQNHSTPRNKSKYDTVDATPAVHKSIINLKMPKTPATPEWMGHDTWLNQTTIGAGDVQPLLAQVAALREQLDGANNEVDNNLRRLGKSGGFDQTSIVNKLMESSDRVHDLEVELKRVHDGQDEDRRSIEALIAERENIVKLSDTLQDELQKAETKVMKLENKLTETAQMRRRFDTKVDECDELQRLNRELQEEGRETHEELARQEKDLNRMNREFMILGQDLEMLKNERDGLEQRKMASHNQLKDELMSSEARVRALEAQLSSSNGKGSGMSAEERGNFIKERRGLAIEIKYHKAKFGRERALREDLICQKKYLLLLVGGLRLTQDATIAAISKIGFMEEAAKRPQKKASTRFRSAAFAVIAINRMKNAKSNWQAQRSERDRLVAARSSRR
ncbi:hypothetical protein E3P99_03019 [Wallemia hederae]|uniref:Pericentrin/AKAP-450 centrosomal targeting domain-containing protein n=1 Tax=Wallemia hederae TaxID=1540922 RepID=A0A4T0FHN8_9BASI|nr:hypothetical protein E3P99_03019 [Wallemia hederae]